MENFIYHSPTKIIFGRGAENQAADEILHYGSRVLLHYGGGSVKKSGLYGRMVKTLSSAGVFFKELGGVVPNPRLSPVHEGIRLCRENRLDFVLAVGGGSVIDSAKAIALGVPYEGDVWDFYARKSVPKETLPVGVVLTIAAAGSESSNSSVILNEETGQKTGLNTEIQRPKFALMNPELTFTLPAYQTACGGLDMTAHVLERYFTKTKAVDFTDRLCEAAIKTIVRNLPIALRRPDDYDARAELMWAGAVAHNNLLGVGREQDWGCHKISHAISARFDATHGAALGVLFPAWMKYVYREDPARFAQFAVRVWGAEYTRDPEEAALEGIRRFEAFVRSAGLPVTLSGLGVPEGCLEELADACTANGTLEVGFFKKLKKKDVLEILRLAQ